MQGPHRRAVQRGFGERRTLTAVASRRPPRPCGRAGRPPAPAGARRRRLRWRRAVSPVALLLAWEAAARAGVLRRGEAARAQHGAAHRLAARRATARSARTCCDSLTRAGIGLVIGGRARRCCSGAIAGLLRLGDDLVDPPVQMARMLPHLALVPLLIIWVGIGESLKITLVALGAFFPHLLQHLRRHPRHRRAAGGGGPHLRARPAAPGSGTWCCPARCRRCSWACGWPSAPPGSAWWSASRSTPRTGSAS